MYLPFPMFFTLLEVYVSNKASLTLLLKNFPWYSFSTDLLLMNSCFHFSKSIHIIFIFENIVLGYRIQGWQTFCCSTVKMSFYRVLASIIYDPKTVVLYIIVPLYIVCLLFLADFKIFPLFLACSSLIMIYLHVGFFF